MFLTRELDVSQIRVTVEEVKEEVKGKEDPHIESKGHPEEGHQTEDNQDRQIPLEEMTKDQLIEKIKEVQQLKEKDFDLYIRSQAEIENIKKRFQKEKEDLLRFSNNSLIRQLLAVMDNLENAITHSQNENSVHALREGLNLTLKGMVDTLGRAGLEEVKAVGEPFDPNFHEAVSEHEDDSVEPGTVLQELQKGYMLNQRLIRPAMVIISKSRI